ncbi:polyketide cyclase / dehydrase and lipid transport protein [Wolffia australiana]
MISIAAIAGPLPRPTLVKFRHLPLPRRHLGFSLLPSSSPLRSRPETSIAGASSPPDEPSPLPNGDQEGSEDEEIDDGVQVELLKVGLNRRRVGARISVDAPLEAVWAVLTDYEGLADFLPGLAVCQLLQKAEGFARLYQVGQQDLALGLKFEAKAILDCYEKDLEILPSGRRRDIEFKMIEGDFQTFDGVWSILQAATGDRRDENVDVAFGEQEPSTLLSYMVELEPKLWLPVRLLEGRIKREIKVNLRSIRDRAQLLTPVDSLNNSNLIS